MMFSIAFPGRQPVLPESVMLIPFQVCYVSSTAYSGDYYDPGLFELIWQDLPATS